MIKLSDILTKKDQNLTYNWEYIETIPEFALLKEKQQSPKWHGEGTAWEHTKCVCSSLLNNFQTDESLTMEEFEILIVACLFHDIGKSVSTTQGKDGRWHSYNHEITGEKITRRLLWDYEFREEVCSLVRWHMEPTKLFDNKDPLDRIVFLSKRVPSIKLLYCLKFCDIMGSIMENQDDKYDMLTRISLFKEYSQLMTCFDKKNSLTIGPKLKQAVTLNNDKRKKINAYVMIGLPGAGKDTWISENIDKTNSEIVCRDDIRAELNMCNPGDKIVGTPEQENLVTEICNNRILNAAKSGKNIVLNGINLKRKYRDAYKTLLSNYFVTWIFVYVEADSLNKNLTRRDGQITREIYESMISNFEWPDPDEYDKLLKRRT